MRRHGRKESAGTRETERRGPGVVSSFHSGSLRLGTEVDLLPRLSMRVSDWFFPALWSAMAATLVGVLVGREAGLAPGWGAAAIIFVVGLAFGMRTRWRRSRIASRPFPEDWRAWLDTHVPLYAEGAETERERFEQTVLVALDAWSIEGVDGVTVDDTLRLAVAAGAGVMLWGRPDWDVPEGRSMLLYPGTFDDEYGTADDASDFDGMAHPQGPVIFSAPAVLSGWERKDGYNVVLHELAHVFDFDPEGADGLPAFLDPRSVDAWEALVRKEMRRAKTGKGILRSYAATNPAELFAVSTEQFFERPSRLRLHHPELFEALAALYNVVPPDEDVEAPASSFMSRRWSE